MGAKLKNLYLKSPVHPSFFLLAFWFLITKNFLSFIVFILVVFSHEYGHYIVAKRKGYKLDHFYIASYGISLNYKEKVFDNRDEITIALAGPFVNILLSIILIMFWWIFPETYFFSRNFVVQSLMLGVFNLLPCYPLDGGRVFCGLLSNKIPRIKAIKIAFILNYVFSFIFFVFFIHSCFYNFNPTFLIFSIFLIVGNMDLSKEAKYQPLYLFEKEVKNYSRSMLVYVNGDQSIKNVLKHIEPNKFIVFVVKLEDNQTKIIDEEKIKKLAIVFSPALTFNDIFIQDKE